MGFDGPLNFGAKDFCGDALRVRKDECACISSRVDAGLANQGERNGPQEPLSYDATTPQASHRRQRHEWPKRTSRCLAVRAQPPSRSGRHARLPSVAHKLNWFAAFSRGGLDLTLWYDAFRFYPSYCPKPSQFGPGLHRPTQATPQSLSRVMRFSYRRIDCISFGSFRTSLVVLEPPLRNAQTDTPTRANMTTSEIDGRANPNRVSGHRAPSAPLRQCSPQCGLTPVTMHDAPLNAYSVARMQASASLRSSCLQYCTLPVYMVTSALHDPGSSRQRRGGSLRNPRPTPLRGPSSQTNHRACRSLPTIA